MHPALSQMSEKLCVLAAGVLEPVREDRQAVRGEVAGGEMAFVVGGLGEAATPGGDVKWDGRRAAEDAPEDVPQQPALPPFLRTLGGGLGDRPRDRPCPPPYSAGTTASSSGWRTPSTTNATSPPATSARTALRSSLMGSRTPAARTQSFSDICERAGCM